MLDFMVLGAPRSATAWCSVWLTTKFSLCFHDPLWEVFYQDLDTLARPTLTTGIADTGLAQFSKWTISHPARKVILHRPILEVNRSLKALGLPPVEQKLEHQLDSIPGMHVDWRDVFQKPKLIFEYATGQSFDPEHHARLKSMKITTDFTQRKMPAVVRARYLAHGVMINPPV